MNKTVGEIVNKHNSNIFGMIKVKPVYVTPSTYIDFGFENNDKDSKFKIGDYVKNQYTKTFFQRTAAFSIVLKEFVIVRKS